MKATLTFRLPDETSEFTLATRAGALWTVLHSHVAWLNQKIKYEEDLVRREVYQDAYNDLLDNMETRGVTLDTVE